MKENDAREEVTSLSFKKKYELLSGRYKALAATFITLGVAAVAISLFFIFPELSGFQKDAASFMGGMSSEALGLILFIGGGIVSLVNYFRFMNKEDGEVAPISLWAARALTFLALAVMAFSLHSVFSFIPGFQEFFESPSLMGSETLSLDLLVVGAGLTLMTALGHLVHICRMKSEEALLESIALVGTEKSTSLGVPQEFLPTTHKDRQTVDPTKHNGTYNLNLESSAQNPTIAAATVRFLKGKAVNHNTEKLESTTTQQGGNAHSTDSASVSGDETPRDAVTFNQTIVDNS